MKCHLQLVADGAQSVRTGRDCHRMRPMPSECPLMERSGRAPALPAECWQGGTEDKEHAMSQKLDTSPAVIGILRQTNSAPANKFSAARIDGTTLSVCL
jgi:hypothetical protein